MELNDDELKHEHWHVQGGGCKRITHLPTAISVERLYDNSATVREIHVQLLKELAQKSLSMLLARISVLVRPIEKR